MRVAHFVSLLLLFVVFTGTGQAQSPEESESVRQLNQKVASQADQLALQQQQIKALQSSLDEQKAMLLRLLNASPGAKPITETASAPVPSATPPPVSKTESSSLSATVTPPPPPQTSNQTQALRKEQAEQPYVKEAHWYEKYSLRGYVQIRDNGLFRDNDAYRCEQCDRSIGPDNNIFVRRARLVISGNVSNHVAVYIQPDFASTSGTSLNYAQLRDAYFDASFDQKKTHRIRAGQSKIPFGFEEMQSSQNRLDLDRTDALNSAFPNERDIGVFYYWAPAHIRARFNELVSRGLKGSGDYGVVGAGIFNGQLLNASETNEDLHYVARYTYPFQLKNGQFIETSIQAYTGKFDVLTRSPGVKGVPDFRYNDRRVALSLIVYPQPLGFQAEYNWGTGPKYNPATNFIDQKGLNGGYAMVNYMWHLSHGVVLTPFTRFQYYNGGKKQELDARNYLVREGDIGIEAQFGKYVELTPQYQKGDRTFEDALKPVNRQKGSLLRLQLQFNY